TGTQRTSARQDLALSEGQLRDYEARLGKPFPHSTYQTDLMELRDRLKVALSATSTEPGTEGASNPRELAERIRALKESHTLDSPPQAPRLSSRSPTAERPVTTRIRDRQDPAPPPPESAAQARSTPEAS